MQAEERTVSTGDNNNWLPSLEESDRKWQDKIAYRQAAREMDEKFAKLEMNRSDYTRGLGDGMRALHKYTQAWQMRDWWEAEGRFQGPAVDPYEGMPADYLPLNYPPSSGRGA